MRLQKIDLFGAFFLLAAYALDINLFGVPILTGLPGFIPSLLLHVIVVISCYASCLLYLEILSSLQPQAHFASIFFSYLKRCIAWPIFGCFLLFMLVCFIDNISTLIQLINYYLKTTSYSFSYLQLYSIITIVVGSITLMGMYVSSRVAFICISATILALIWLYFKIPHHVITKNITLQTWIFFLVPAPFLYSSYTCQPLLPSLVMSSNIKTVLKALQRVFILLPLVIIGWQFLVLSLVPRAMVWLQFDTGSVDAQGIELMLNLPILKTMGSFLLGFTSFAAILSHLMIFIDVCADGIGKIGYRTSLLFRTLMILFVFLLGLCIHTLLNSNLKHILSYLDGFISIFFTLLLPIIIVWIIRYEEEKRSVKIVKGGKSILLVLLLYAVLLLFFEGVSLSTI